METSYYPSSLPLLSPSSPDQIEYSTTKTLDTPKPQDQELINNNKNPENVSLFCYSLSSEETASSGSPSLFLNDPIELKWDDNDDYDDDSVIYTRRRNVNNNNNNNGNIVSSSNWGEAWSNDTECDLIPFGPVVPNRLKRDFKPDCTGAGLANLGNTCFLNAVLQCFIHTVPFLEGILSDTQFNCDQQRFCILCSLNELIKLSFTSSERAISPWKLVHNLSYFSSSFRRYQQEDAHEFLQCFLDKLESCHNLNLKDSFHDLSGKDSVPLKSDNFVKQVFGGRLVSKLKCCNCDHCSDTYEPSIDLSLEIEDADNLVTALHSFTKVEKIEDAETKFKCEECKQQVSIEKQLAFDEVPSVAVFQLKRFKNTGYFTQKIDKHVAFPLEFDLLPFTSGGKANEVELKYVLYAVVVHNGLSSTSGHYCCFIRLSPNMWCKFDDSRVVRVEEDFVLSQEAYILFYAKEGTSWFSSFFETQKLCLQSTGMSTSPRSVLNTEENLSSSSQQKEIVCDSNEAVDATGLQLRVENSEIKDSEPIQNNPEANQCEDTLQSISISVAPISSDSSDVSSRKALEEVSPSLLENVRLRGEVAAVGNSRSIMQTPPRSPSPDIFREDPPDTPISISRNHLHSVDRICCKRPLEKDVDDMNTKQAYSFIKKSIPGSRGQQLLAALKGSMSEGSINRKKSRRLGLSEPRDAFRSLAAGAFR